MIDLTIVPTFDDGPSAQPLESGTNYTRLVLDVLDFNPTRKGIRAGFFVQTHVPFHMAADVPFAKNPGKQVLKAAHDAGHVIGIHTGSEEDHVNHPERASRQLLRQDMNAAQAALGELLGETPRFVRAPYGNLGKGTIRQEVVKTYRDNHLKHIGWNIDSRDASMVVDGLENRFRQPSEVREQLNAQIRNEVTASAPKALVILFHDINVHTQQRTVLESYLAVIAEAVAARGRNPKFARTQAEVRAVFDAF